MLSVAISASKGSGLSAPLPGAEVGANEFAKWAKAQGHTVRRFSDKSKRFTAIDIENAITPFLDRQALSSLFIYFAGHGECFGWDQDYWILANDRPRTGDVIDVAGTVQLARRAGVPRVVIFADACRNVFGKVDFGLDKIASPILPLMKNDTVTVTIDRFLAAGPGTAALEVQYLVAAEQSYGVFTRVLMKALRGEVPEIQERNRDNDRMVVGPGSLRLHLHRAVPQEAGALKGGYPQKPDCNPESDEPLALLGKIPKVTVKIQAVFPDGKPVAKCEIALLTHQGSANWDSHEVITGSRAEFRLPAGLVCKSTVTRIGFEFKAIEPMPLFELSQDISGKFQVIKAPFEFTRRVSAGPSPTLTAARAVPRFGITRVMDAAGRLHARAPSAGVFRVVTDDPVTQAQASQWQEFATKEQAPRSVPTRVDDSALAKISQTATQHGRVQFETQTGFTVIGVPSGQTLQVAAAPGVIEAVFQDGVDWQIRGIQSGGVIISLGSDHFAAVPIFKELVGALRISDGGGSPVAADLSYAPAANSRFSHDLIALDYHTDLIAGNARDEVDALQLIAAACARNGFFEVTIDNSIQLAQRMRQLKHHNPVFGVIAAYAYDQAGRRDQIVDMIRWFIRERQTIPFDLAMLADYAIDRIEALAEESWGKRGARQVLAEVGAWVSPAWPMLTQGWAKLPGKYLKAFPILEEARRSLAPGLWTTVVGEPGKRLFSEAGTGQLQWI